MTVGGEADGGNAGWSHDHFGAILEGTLLQTPSPAVFIARTRTNIRVPLVNLGSPPGIGKTSLN
jgi:hypothetical protein